MKKAKLGLLVTVSVLVLVAATASIGFAADEVLFSDDFQTDTIGTTWTVTDDPNPAEPSDWYVLLGKLHQGGNIFRTDNEYSYFQGTHITAGDVAWTDYKFSYTLHSSDDDGIGAVFRYTDKNNYYRFMMVRDSGNKGPFRRIDKVVNGVPKVLASDNKGSYEVNKDISIDIKVSGNTIEVWMDGAKILSAVDSSFKSGKIGFSTYACSVEFTNVKVTKLEVAAPVEKPASPAEIKNAATVSRYVNVNVNGGPLKTDVKPFVNKDGRTMLPLRAVGEALGATVGWSPETQTATLTLNGKVVEVKVNSSIIIITGRPVSMDTLAVVKDGRTLLPVRAVGEALGANIGFDSKTQTVQIQASAANTTGGVIAM